MRIMRIARGGDIWLAASRDGEGWRALESGRNPARWDILDALAQKDGLVMLGDAILKDGVSIDLNAEEVLPPVPLTGKVLCVGLNYLDHIAEGNFSKPEDVTVFLRTPGSLVAHNAPIVRPLGETTFDYEAELAIVIGKPGRRISRTTALDHVAGYTLVNDGSIRDAQMRGAQWTLGKNHDASGSIGPCIAAASSLPPGARDLRLIGRLNGDIVQDGDTSQLVFDVPRIIETISAAMTLHPGDVIATGTPAGVAMGGATPRWLRPGDRFEVTVEGIGTLRNPVKDEADFR